jgi:HD-GYP domain-containing protein (c-di-GMP phosphodiesterase class II)
MVLDREKFDGNKGKLETKDTGVNINKLIRKYKELISLSSHWFESFNIDDWNWRFYLNLEFWNIKEIDHSFNIFYYKFLDKLENISKFNINSKRKLYSIFTNLYISSKIYTWWHLISSIDFKKLLINLRSDVFNDVDKSNIDYLLNIELFPYMFLLQDEKFLEEIKKDVESRLKLYDSQTIEQNYLRYVKLKSIYYISLFFLNKSDFDKKRDEIIKFISHVNANTFNFKNTLWRTVSFLKDVISYILYKEYWYVSNLDNISLAVSKILDLSNKRYNFEDIIITRYEQFENKLYLLDFLILKLYFDVSKLDYNSFINIKFNIVKNLFHTFGKDKFDNIYFKKLENINEFPKWNVLSNTLKVAYEYIMSRILNDLKTSISYTRFDVLYESLVKLLGNVRILILDENGNVKYNYWFSEVDISNFKKVNYLTHWWTYIENFDNITLTGKKFCFHKPQKCYLVFMDRWLEAVNRFSYEDLKVLDKVLYTYFWRELGDLSTEKKELLYEFLTNLIIWYLSRFKDTETGEHMKRVGKYVGLFVRDILIKPYIEDDLYYSLMKLGIKVNKEDLPRLLEKFSPWHDIWKIEIPDSILKKPGKLTKEEFEAMKYHTVLGASYVENILSIDLLKNEKVILELIALTHHLVLRNYPIDVSTWRYNLDESVVEKFNLNKYLIESFVYSPFFQEFLKLYREDEKFRRWILFLSLAIGLPDAFDAMNSKRVYKPEFSLDKIKKFLIEDLENFIKRIWHYQDQRLLEAFNTIKENIDKFLNLFITNSNIENE